MSVTATGDELGECARCAGLLQLCMVDETTRWINLRAWAHAHPA